MKITPAERDASLLESVGMTWEQIADEHDMRCGACRGGVLELHTVQVVIRPWGWLPENRKTVTVELHCTVCASIMEMPFLAKEK